MKLLTVREVALRLNISRSTFYKMLQAGEFPPAPYRVRGRPRWPESLVDSWIEGQRAA
ncbi:MAG: helix-turn-helix domain-containing protein [Acidobacteria bacterium]|nr:helix-turn-helix domain-containing protein [Acidobacteriota bacterium]